MNESKWVALLVGVGVMMFIGDLRQNKLPPMPADGTTYSDDRTTVSCSWYESFTSAAVGQQSQVDDDNQITTFETVIKQNKRTVDHRLTAIIWGWAIIFGGPFLLILLSMSIGKRHSAADGVRVTDGWETAMFEGDDGVADEHDKPVDYDAQCHRANVCRIPPAVLHSVVTLSKNAACYVNDDGQAVAPRAEEIVRPPRQTGDGDASASTLHDIDDGALHQTADEELSLLQPKRRQVKICLDCQMRLTLEMRLLQRQRDNDGVRLSAGEGMKLAHLQLLFQGSPPTDSYATMADVTRFYTQLTALLQRYPLDCCFNCGVCAPSPS